MFVYNYPNPEIETKIIIECVNGEIITCEWWKSIRQWVDIRRPITPATISYLEDDIRLKDGVVKWCYMSEFKKFINLNQILNIKEEI